MGSSVQSRYLASNQYWDRYFGKRAVKLLPGEYYAGVDVPLIVTVLGSCVSACIRDPVLGVSGMNHFMLAQAQPGDETVGAARYGVHAMELLINHLMTLGASRKRLEVKLFGGGNLMGSSNPRNVGFSNARFALEFFERERLRVVSQDLFGEAPRKIWYIPETGKVMLKRLRVVKNNTILERERNYARQLMDKGQSGDVELFE